MEKWKDLVKKLEKNILKLEIEPESGIISEIFELLQTFLYLEIPQEKEILIKQLKILIEEIKKEEIPLNKESIHTLSLIVRRLQTNEEEKLFEEDDKLSLMKEFFIEATSLIEDIVNQKGDISSLLHRLKGTLGIYISLSNGENKNKGKVFLEKIKELEKKAKEGSLTEKEIKEIKRLFDLLKESYGKI